ncbi:uncharacterized protein Z519_03401 [Cladophialophora bantiana CBS 173.52]|uniref:Uncharacterized protein n=1 Tax=Cladophialophora bantiana (strain ATCC 10958 / CBS 173.52 / CDC B-1940 / NIH 8579) TaxID=1442370 RepID=A0A0D2GD33_CLAB1|nr:uncharacterized protein Z519_03401 [Cladophialophora bantiana CBS 173.52]KIW96332.1 hypothetical protein Z519_03401 [Cladophialophora bantiana CBS 173.52]
MRRGRPAIQCTEGERLAIRREQVRLNVQAHRQRQKLKKQLESLNTPYQPRFRWVQETKWQSKKSTDRRDQCRLEGSVTPRRERYPEFECTLPNHPSSAKQYTLALLALFRSRLLPDRVTLPCPGPPGRRLTTPCAPWVVKGYELAAVKENPLVMGMLRALGLALLGADHQREDILRVALRTYQTTLAAVSRQIQLLMNNYNCCSNDCLALILSCHATAMFEMNVSKSMPDLLRHVRGLGSLLVHRFLQSQSMPEEMYDLVEEYRLFETVFCLINRQQSVLVGTSLCREAKDPSKPDLGNCHMSPFSKLVHLARHVPPIMVYLDELKTRPATSDQELGRISESLETLSEVKTGLETWSEDFLRNDTHSVMKSTAYISGHGDLESPSLDVVAAWTFYLSFKVYALETYISLLEYMTSIQSSATKVEPCEDRCGTIDAQLNSPHEKIILSRSELLETAKLLLRSLPYFSASSLGYIGRSLVAFPLETVKRAFLHEFERQSRLRLTASEIPHLNFVDYRTHDIVQGLAAWKRIAANAKASGCALFSD